MKVLQVHNRYYSGIGGEDVVFELECDLLRKAGNDVEQLVVSTSELRDRNALGWIQAGVSTVWSHRGYRLVSEAIERHRPDVMHVHNIFPLLSASVFWAASRAGVPVVVTIHNFRFSCIAGSLLRDGRICELCVGRFPWAALRHRCYRRSLPLSLLSVSHNQTHRALGSFESKVDAYITLSEFARRILVRAGFPADRLHVKPNFVNDPGGFVPGGARRRQVVYAGLLAPYKGPDLLLEAWTRLKPKDTVLFVFGEGPLKPALQERYRDDPTIRWMGWCERELIIERMSRSQVVVIPSRWYEGLPMVLLESLSVGTAVIAPNHGTFPDVLTDGENGFLFTPSDASSLASALARALDTPPAQCADEARKSYLARYTPERNYDSLMQVYRGVMSGSSSQPPVRRNENSSPVAETWNSR